MLTPRRWIVLSGHVARPVLGFAVLAMALVIMLPIPFGNVMPVFAIAILALALLERDGLAVIAGLIMAALALAWTSVLVLFGAETLAHLSRLWT